jgi:hypothetical protein
VLTPLTYHLTAPMAAMYSLGHISVPRGFITDLASIPRLLRPVLDQNDASRAPAVLHDYLYCGQFTSRAAADLLFLEALQRAGISRIKRYAMYAAVRTFGRSYWDARPNGLMPGEDIIELEAS